MRLLEPDPRKRMGAREALQAPWFTRAEPRINRDRPWELSAPPFAVSAGTGFKQGVDHHEFSSRARRKAVPGPAEGGPAAAAPPEAASAADLLDAWVGHALSLPCDSAAEMRAAAAGLQRAAGHLVTQLQGLAAAPQLGAADGGTAAADRAGGLEARVTRLYNAVHTKLSAINARLLAAEGSAGGGAAAAAAPAPPQGLLLLPRVGSYGSGGGGAWPQEAPAGFSAPPVAGTAPEPRPGGGGSRWGERFDDRSGRRPEGGAAAAGPGSRRGRSRSRSR